MTGSYTSIHVDQCNSGYVPDQTKGKRDRETFETIWSSTVDSELKATPVVSDELVIIGDTGGGVTAFDAIDGREQWQTELDTSSVLSTAAVADEMVFVSGFDDLNRFDKTTFALDLATGDVQWSREFGQGGKTAVATDGERVYVPTYDGTCHALAADTGETVWRMEGERWSKTPAIVDGSVILGDGETLVALDAERGSERWQADLDGHVRTPVARADGQVYVIAGSNDLWCLDAASGGTHWSVDIGETIRDDPAADDPLLPFGGRVLHGKPVTDGDTVILGIYDGVVELDATQGNLRRYYPLDLRIGDPLLVGGGRERRLYGHVRNEGVTEVRLAADATVLRSTSRDTLDSVPTYAAGVFYLVSSIGVVSAVA